MLPQGFDHHDRAQPDRADQLDIAWQGVVRTLSFSLREPINDLQITNPSDGLAQTNQLISIQLIGATKIVNDVSHWFARLWMALVVRELVILGHAAVFVSSA